MDTSLLWYVSYIVVLIGLAGYGSHRLTIVFLYLKHSRKHPQPKELFKELPLVTIQLLDDSTDETVEICRAGIEGLKARGFDAEHIHRTDRTGYKAGALENGTRFAKGEYLLILDADFVPNPDLLQKTIHYFSDDKIGMIQTRWGHLNRTFNVLTRIQA
ncbi:MAG: glycosyltransferase, partial [Verrucomicrobiaceae bacterium]